MQYSAYTVEEFCSDTDFIRWVVAPDQESDQYWRAFIATHPHKAEEVQQAIEHIKVFHFQEINPSPDTLLQLKQRIWADIDEPVRRLAWYRNSYWVAAAAVFLVVSIGLSWWLYDTNLANRYETAFGEIQTIRLADGSMVALNANSSLRVTDALAEKFDGKSREVWLNGEAYFAIAKRSGAKFIVHTADADVEVLGTEFNVNTRRNQTKVVLHEGKVQLRAVNVPAVVMKPGDMATISKKSPTIQLKIVQPDQYDAWKESFLVLDGKSVSEIISEIEDTYGLSITLEDSTLFSKKLTGKLSLKVPEDCIDNLAIILDSDVVKNETGYTLK